MYLILRLLILSDYIVNNLVIIHLLKFIFQVFLHNSIFFCFFFSHLHLYLVCEIIIRIIIIIIRRRRIYMRTERDALQEETLRVFSEGDCR